MEKLGTSHTLPILNLRLGLTQKCINFMRDWKIKQLGTEVVVEEDIQAYVWHGRKADHRGEVPVIGASLPHGEQLSSDSSQWFWGTAPRDVAYSAPDMEAALLENAVHMSREPRLALLALKAHIEVIPLAPTSISINLPLGRHNR